jgi:hypothetical protein
MVQLILWICIGLFLATFFVAAVIVSSAALLKFELKQQDDEMKDMLRQRRYIMW